MMNVTGDFSRGAFCGNQINGFQVAEMQRQENTDRLVYNFEQLISMGYNPNNDSVIKLAFDKTGVNQEDTTSYDKDEMISRVERSCSSNRYHW